MTLLLFLLYFFKKVPKILAANAILKLQHLAPGQSQNSPLRGSDS